MSSLAAHRSVVIQLCAINHVGILDALNAWIRRIPGISFFRALRKSDEIKDRPNDEQKQEKHKISFHTFLPFVSDRPLSLGFARAGTAGGKFLARFYWHQAHTDRTIQQLVWLSHRHEREQRMLDCQLLWRRVGIELFPQ